MIRDGVAYNRAKLQTRHAPKIIITIIIIIIIIINDKLLTFYLGKLVMRINSSYYLRLIICHLIYYY